MCDVPHHCHYFFSSGHFEDATFSPENLRVSEEILEDYHSCCFIPDFLIICAEESDKMKRKSKLEAGSRTTM